MSSPQILSSEALKEFKTAYEEEFGEQLSDKQVHEISLRLLRFFDVLADLDQESLG